MRPTRTFASSMRGAATTGKLVAYAVFLTGIALSSCTYQTATCCERFNAHVNKTETVTSGKSSKYLVYTDKGVFENTDSFFHGKFNSSDMHNKLNPGKDYEFKAYGWRMPFFSMYPNIIEATAVASQSAIPGVPPVSAQSGGPTLTLEAADCTSPETLSRLAQLGRQGFNVKCSSPGGDSPSPVPNIRF